MKRTALTSTPHRRLQTVRGLNRYLHCPPAAFTANNTFRPGSRYHLTFFSIRRQEGVRVVENGCMYGV
jgi:hypothetical protein